MSGTGGGGSWQTVQNIMSSGERNKRKRKEEAAGSMTASERECNFLQRELRLFAPEFSSVEVLL
jgi:hypothetical protein